MFAALASLIILVPVMFLTCSGPTHSEQIRQQADRIYAQIQKQRPEETCQEIRNILRRPGFVDILRFEVHLNDETFLDVPQQDRDDVRELSSLLRDPCRGQR